MCVLSIAGKRGQTMKPTCRTCSYFEDEDNVCGLSHIARDGITLDPDIFFCQKYDVYNDRSINSPYLIELDANFNVIHTFNENYDSSKICICGHPCYRHFDPYEDNCPVGCKYCNCYEFTPFATEHLCGVTKILEHILSDFAFEKSIEAPYCTDQVYHWFRKNIIDEQYLPLYELIIDVLEENELCMNNDNMGIDPTPKMIDLLTTQYSEITISQLITLFEAIIENNE